MFTIPAMLSAHKIRDVLLEGELSCGVLNFRIGVVVID